MFPIFARFFESKQNDDNKITKTNNELSLKKWCERNGLEKHFTKLTTDLGFKTVDSLISLDANDLKEVAQELNLKFGSKGEFLAACQKERDKRNQQKKDENKANRKDCDDKWEEKGDVLQQEKEIKETKEITTIILGVTGAGKSSLINLFYVWSKGIKKVENIDEVLISTKFHQGKEGKNVEINAKDQSKSQTMECTIYKFTMDYGSTRYILNFMDTPGLGDVDGIEKDDEHISKILDTVSKTPELNAIVLMINGSDPRVSDRLKYVITKLMGIIPNMAQQNLLVLLSNVCLKPNLDVKTILNLDIPAHHIIYMDNLIFTIDCKVEPQPTIEEANFAYSKSKDKLKKVLEIASTMKISKTSGFVELKQQRDSFKHEIHQLRAKYETLMEHQERLQTFMNELLKDDMTKTTLNVQKTKKTKTIHRQAV